MPGEDHGSALGDGDDKAKYKKAEKESAERMLQEFHKFAGGLCVLIHFIFLLTDQQPLGKPPMQLTDTARDVHEDCPQ